MNGTAEGRAAAGQKWVPLAILGVVAVAAGLVLPQVLPSAATPAKSEAPSSSSNSTGSLTYTPPAWSEPPNYRGMFLRLALGTAIVLGLCVGTLWCCKRWLRPAPTPANANTQLRLLESLHLGNRCWVHLLHVAKRPVLVGVDAAGVKTLVPLADSFSNLLDAPDEAAPEATPPQASGRTDSPWAVDAPAKRNPLNPVS
jgi:flagellar biogenesis protein FliO